MWTMSDEINDEGQSTKRRNILLGSVSIGTWWRCTAVCTPSKRGGFMKANIVLQVYGHMDVDP